MITVIARVSEKQPQNAFWLLLNHIATCGHLCWQRFGSEPLASHAAAAVIGHSVSSVSVVLTTAYRNAHYPVILLTVNC